MSSKVPRKDDSEVHELDHTGDNKGYDYLDLDPTTMTHRQIDNEVLSGPNPKPRTPMQGPDIHESEQTVSDKIQQLIEKNASLKTVNSALMFVSVVYGILLLIICIVVFGVIGVFKGDNKDSPRNITITSGAVYVRWGRTTCPSVSEIAYAGIPVYDTRPNPVPVKEICLIDTFAKKHNVLVACTAYIHQDDGAFDFEIAGLAPFREYLREDSVREVMFKARDSHLSISRRDMPLPAPLPSPAVRDQLLSQDAIKMTVKELRPLVTTIVAGGARRLGRQKEVWTEDRRPSWWPKNLTFKAPTEPGNKAKKKDLCQIVEAYKTHLKEYLAPQQSQLEDFSFHWKSITNYFINNKDDKKPVQESNIPSHLENMLVILTQEENQMEDNQTGPCMEHLLQHNILETLHTLGKADCPPGMKKVVLTFFTNLLEKIKQPLLPHVNVYKPVHRLLKVCGNVQAASTEREEMHFLLLVCAKLTQDPYLVNFFLDESKELPQLGSGNSQPEFSLVNSLLNLSQSPDARIAVKACEGLMLVASLPEKLAAQCIKEYTQFCTWLAERLCTLYNALPLSMDPVDVDSVEAKWGLDVYSDAEDTNMFPGKRQLISLLSWFDYCDQMAKSAHPIVSKALATSIKEKFLIPIMEPLILQTSEVGILTSTAHLVKFVEMTTSKDLLAEFVFFILGSATDKELPRGTDHKLRQRLIARCDHSSDEIIIMSLKLFETLLKKPHEHIITNLVLRNLQTRAYIDRTALPPPTTQNDEGGIENGDDGQDTLNNDDYHAHLEQVLDDWKSVSNEIDSNYVVENNGDIDGQNEAPKCENHIGESEVNQNDPAKGDDSDPMGQVIDRTESEQSQINANSLIDSIFTNGPETLAAEIIDTNENPDPTSPLFDLSPIFSPVSLLPATLGSPSLSDISVTPSASSVDSKEGVGIHKVVNCFLTLMPEKSKSSYLTGDVGYDMYLREAHRQFRECTVNCLPWDWPTYPTPLDKCGDDEVFYEGALVKMLYDKLTRMLDQTYEVNLQVTSVLSKITLFSHPHIHEYYLNPFLPVTPGCRTLNTVLLKVMNDLSMRMKAIPDFQSQVIQVRKQLIGMADEDDSLPHIDLLEGAIVLKEFCKELATVAFVKFHAASGQAPH